MFKEELLFLPFLFILSVIKKLLVYLKYIKITRNKLTNKNRIKSDTSEWVEYTKVTKEYN